MAVKIENSYGQISPEQIQAFEARTGIDLPDAYRKFLLASNGGEPTPDVFDVPDWHGQSTILAGLYGIHDGPHRNLEKVLKGSAGVLPPQFLAIAEDAGGNLVCLGIQGKHRGHIYFWDHEDELDEDGKSKLDMSNMYLLAKDLNSFLDKLMPLPE